MKFVTCGCLTFDRRNVCDVISRPHGTYDAWGNTRESFQQGVYNIWLLGVAGLVENFLTRHKLLNDDLVPEHMKILTYYY